MVNGNHSQVSAAAIAHNAVSALEISELTGNPMNASARCSGLTSVTYMIFQMIATTIGGSTIGIRKAVRTASRKRERMLSSSATPSPTRSCSTTVATDSLTCTHTELRKRGSTKAAR